MHAPRVPEGSAGRSSTAGHDNSLDPRYQHGHEFCIERGVARQSHWQISLSAGGYTTSCLRCWTPGAIPMVHTKNLWLLAMNGMQYLGEEQYRLPLRPRLSHGKLSGPGRRRGVQQLTFVRSRIVSRQREQATSSCECDTLNAPRAVFEQQLIFAGSRGNKPRNRPQVERLVVPRSSLPAPWVSNSIGG